MVKKSIELILDESLVKMKKWGFLKNGMRFSMKSWF